MSAEVIPFSRPQAVPRPNDVPESEGPPIGSEALSCLACTHKLGMMQMAFYCTRFDVRCWVCHEVQVFDE